MSTRQCVTSSSQQRQRLQRPWRRHRSRRWQRCWQPRRRQRQPKLRCQQRQSARGPEPPERAWSRARGLLPAERRARRSCRKRRARRQQTEMPTGATCSCVSSIEGDGKPFWLGWIAPATHRLLRPWTGKPGTGVQPAIISGQTLDSQSPNTVTGQAASQRCISASSRSRCTTSERRSLDCRACQRSRSCSST